MKTVESSAVFQPKQWAEKEAGKTIENRTQTELVPNQASKSNIVRGALILFSLSQRHDPLVTTDTEYWEMRAYRRSDIARGKMRVMLFGHARAGVTELFGDNAHGHAPHGERGTMRVPKDMK